MDQRASYSIFNGNEAESEAAITTEIERHSHSWTTLSYKIGQLKIGLRKAQDKMGVKFDIRKFHEKCLNQA
jgi:uncharacterized protein (DUF885 family)